ncbi:MAG TPA: hypothetical protein PK760_00840, partial [Flavobacteriales bacterium]|nr:hypothetical protein [Flavobacteriales bacterium]
MRSFVQWIPCCAVLMSLGIACRKEVVDSAPPITTYRTYDIVPVLVKEDPLGGYLLLCKNTPIDQRTAFVQFINDDGDPVSTLSFDVLPRTIENVSFDPQEIIYTDIVPRNDGSLLVIGLGRQVAVDNRAHLIIHAVDRTGHALFPASRRFLHGDAEWVVNPVNDARQDPNGLPRTKALGALTGADLMVAARWETAAT